MASKSENSEIAVLQTQMEDVKTNQVRLELKIDEILRKLGEDQEKLATKIELDDLRKEFAKKVWVERVTTVVVTSTITFLILFFLNNLSK